MKPNPRFLNQPKYFWANVRTISEATGYTERARSQIKVPTFAEMKDVLQRVDLATAHILDDHNKPTALGKLLYQYFSYRANILKSLQNHALWM
jgi:hypothetical protein